MPWPQSSGQSAALRQSAGLTPAVGVQSNTLKVTELWDYTASLVDVCDSGCHLGPSVPPHQGHWLPSDRPSVTRRDEWEGQQVRLAGCSPAQHSWLILAPCPRPALPEESRGPEAGQAPTQGVESGMWIKYHFLCRTQEHFGCHPKAWALLYFEGGGERK